MRIDPKNLGNKRKETKKSLLEALYKIGIYPKKSFYAIERSDNEYDVCIEKERFAIKIER